MSSIRVLYIHFTGAFGGASRSLFEALSELPPDEIRPMFLTQRGSVVDFFSELGPVVCSRGLSQFDNTRYSHYRGVRWLVLLREMAYIPLTIHALSTASRRFGDVDLVHVNEFTGLMTLWLSKIYFKAPALVHVRSVARGERSSLRTRFENYLFRKLAAGVVAIDQNVRASLPSDLPVKVIHNSFRVQAQLDTDATLRSLSKLRLGSFKVGFVGNLLKVKGIYELLHAALSLREKGIDVEFIIVGDDAKPSSGFLSRIVKLLGLQQNSKADVERFLDFHKLRSTVHLFGFTSNIGQFYRQMDVICFPSHFDAPGRPIFEAAFYNVPSIVAVTSPCDDTLIHGETGLAISAKSSEEISIAIEYMISHPEKRVAMGRAAFELAKANFDAKRNSDELLVFYKELIRDAS